MVYLFPLCKMYVVHYLDFKTSAEKCIANIKVFNSLLAAELVCKVQGDIYFHYVNLLLLF